MREKIRKLSVGFSMVEILIVLSIIGSMSASMVVIMNPSKMLSKTHDAQRNSDVGKISVKLEEYFNDKECYPTDIPFGQSWKLGETYLMDVPQDPLYPQQTYYYTSGEGCPRWYSIFFKNMTARSTEPACVLPTGCLPANYHSKWGCKISGNIDCDKITAIVLPPEPTAAPNLISSIVSSLTGSTSVPTGVQTTGPITGGTMSVPTSTTAPVPGVPANAQLIGKDGSWCYDTDNHSLLPRNNEYCQDIYGTHYDDCPGTYKARHYMCEGSSLWPVIGFNKVHCGYLTNTCISGQYCSETTKSCAASGVSVFPTPTIGTTLPYYADYLGSDGSWCNDTDDGSYYSRGASCQDSTQKSFDTCEGQTAVENYCSGTWSGSSWNNLSCQIGRFVCPIGNTCINGACETIRSTSTPRPTSIGSTGVGGS